MVSNSIPVYSTLLSLFACLIPPYAFRLARVFGTKRVGWVIFSAFLLLAALQLVRAWHPMGFVLDPALTLDLLYLLVPVLMLIGMVHIEALFKERLRVEQEEKRLRGELELQVKQRTAQLDSANEDLQREISLRKQGEQELRKSKEGYRFLFDENPLPMLIFDLRSLRFLAFNNSALRLYGFSQAEFRELTAADLCAPPERVDFLADCTRISVAGQPRKRWHHLKKDGSGIELEITAHDLAYAECPARLILAYEISSQRQRAPQSLPPQPATKAV
jgi:PAS domain S-box-containing protein